MLKRDLDHMKNYKVTRQDAGVGEVMVKWFEEQIPCFRGGGTGRVVGEVWGGMGRRRGLVMLIFGARRRELGGHLPMKAVVYVDNSGGYWRSFRIRCTLNR